MTMGQPSSGQYGGGSPNLRPYTLADILDLSFRLWRNNWRKLLLLSLIVAVPGSLASAFIQAATYDFGATQSPWAALVSGDPAALEAQDDPLTTRAIIGIIGGSLVALFFGLLIQPIIYGAIVRVVAASNMGRSIDAIPAIRATFSRWWSLLASSLLAGLATLVGLLFCIVGAIVPVTLLSVYIAVVVIEDAGPIKALERSIELTKRRFWWYFLTLVVIYFLGSMLSGVLSTPFLIGSFVASAFEIYFLEWTLVALGSIFSSIVLYPTLVITSVLIYFDARVRFEGLDLQLNNRSDVRPPGSF